jgi:hypothetical protein
MSAAGATSLRTQFYEREKQARAGKLGALRAKWRGRKPNMTELCLTEKSRGYAPSSPTSVPRHCQLKKWIWSYRPIDGTWRKTSGVSWAR